MKGRSEGILRLCSGQNLRLSFRPGRTGWLLHSPLSLEVLRGRLAPWARRVTVLHQATGRYFVEPNERYFLRALTSLSGQNLDFYDCARRADRLRRLANFLNDPPKGRDPRGQKIFLRMALRLDQVGSGSSQLWKHMALDFDELWSTVPLFAMRLGPLPQRVLTLLCGVQGAEKGESHSHEGFAFCFSDGTHGSRRDLPCSG